MQYGKLRYLQKNCRLPTIKVKEILQDTIKSDIISKNMANIIRI
jgi:hypothetical protein